MKIQITEIKLINSDSVEITAIVYCPPCLPGPKIDSETGKFAETDIEYQERAKHNAQQLDFFNNLHIGWAELHQKIEHTTIPHMEDYWS